MRIHSLSASIVLGIFSTLTLVAATASADLGLISDLSAKYPTYPSLSSIPGQPYTATWKDGRVAVLKVNAVDTPLMIANFQVGDNTCAPRQNMVCTYSFRLRQFWVGMVWTKNPDPSKIGQVVKAVLNDGSSVGNPDDLLQASSGAILATNLDQRHQSTIAKGLPAHQIQCNDFSWLPSGLKQAPAKLHVSRWDDEDNQTNGETNLSENRISGGFYGVDLNRTGPQTLSIQGYSVQSGTAGFLQLMFFGGNTSLVMKKADGQICQVGLSSSFEGEITTMVANYDPKPKNPGQTQTYLIGSDELLKNDGAKSALGNFFNDGNKGFE